MDTPSTLASELQEIRTLAATIHGTNLAKGFLRSTVINLALVSVLLLMVAAFLRLDLQDDAVASLFLNLSTELIGSLIIFVILGEILKSFQDQEQSSNTPRPILILGTLSLAMLMFAASSLRLAESLDIGEVAGEFIRSIFLNLSTQVIGSMVIFYVLERTAKVLEERGKKEKLLMEKIDAVAASIAQSNTIPPSGDKTGNP